MRAANKTLQATPGCAFLFFLAHWPGAPELLRYCPMTHVYSCLAFVLVTASLAVGGCGRRSATPPPPAAAAEPWTNLLAKTRMAVLTARWHQAENAYADLRLKAIWPPEELELWMRLQVDILEQTRKDPLKDQIRLSAIQQFYNYPTASQHYLPWLKQGLETNLFSEPRVAEKARQVVLELEGGAK